MDIEIGDITDLPENVWQSIVKARQWAEAKKQYNALAYIDALQESIHHWGTNGCKVQLNYIVCNLDTWRGADAREAKVILKAYIKELP